MNNPFPLRLAILRHAFFIDDPRVYKEARALADAGCDVTVICLRQADERPFENHAGIHIYRLPMGRRRGSKIRYIAEYAFSMILMGWKISCLALKRGFDVIQVNTLPDFLVFAALIPRLLGSRILLDLHEPTPELYETKYGYRASRFVFRLNVFVERLAIRFAHHVLTVNETIRQRFIDRGAPADKITVVRNVPAEDIFSSPLARTTSASRFLMITHGTLEARYGQDILVRALPRLRESIPNIRLRIVGGQGIEPDLRRLAESMRLKDIVEITGWIPMSEVPGHLIQADVGVVPLIRSSFSELCQPNKLFEYVALKVPVIAARVPAIEESFDENSIRFFEPSNLDDLVRAVIDLYQNPEKTKAMAEQAFMRYQLLRWNITKQVYLQTIEHFVGRSLSREEKPEGR